MTPEAFIDFIWRHCEAHIHMPAVSVGDGERRFVYEEIRAMIDAYFKNNKEPIEGE